MKVLIAEASRHGSTNDLASEMPAKVDTSISEPL